MRTEKKTIPRTHPIQEEDDGEEDPLYRAFQLGSRQLVNVEDYVEMEIYFDECLMLKKATENGQQKGAVEWFPDSRLSWDDLKAIGKEPRDNTHKFLFYKAAQVAHHARNFFSHYMFTSQLPIFEVVLTTTDTVSPPHLRTRCRVGDNLEEEWLIAAWALQLTRDMTNVSIAIRDADGEFILVEAAMRLPAWLSPSTARNRVFLRQGVLQIIPISITGSFNTSFSSEIRLQCKTQRSIQRSEPSVLEQSNSACLSLLDALKVLKTDQLKRCVATPAVQKVVMQRIRSLYPVVSVWKSIERSPSRLAFTNARDRVSESESDCDSTPYKPTSASLSATASLCLPHHFRICVPLPIAELLLRFPHLVSIALDRIPPTPDVSRKIQAFFNRNSYTESPSPSDVTKPSSLVFDCQSNLSIPTVFIRIALNRCQYGRLRYLRFKPPARFTRSRWRFPDGAATTQKQLGGEANNSSPHSSDFHHANSDDPSLRQAADFGAKICLGLLISYIEGLNRWDDHAASAIFWSFYDSSLLHTQNFEAPIQNYWSTIYDFWQLLNEACQPLNKEKLQLQGAKVYDGTSFRHSLWGQVANQLNLSAVFDHTPENDGASYGKTHSFHLPVFSSFLECVYKREAKTKQQHKDNDLGDLHFSNSVPTNASRSSSSPFVAGESKALLSISFCHCQTTVAGDLGCAGRHCLKPDESDSWLALSPEEVDAVVQERTLDERCCKWIQQKQAQLHAASDVSITQSSAKTFKRLGPSSAKGSNADEAQVSQELNSLLTRFKTLLNNCSGYEGMDLTRPKGYNRPTEFWKTKEELRGSVPQEFENIFDELYDAQNMMDGSESLSVSDDDESETKAIHDHTEDYNGPHDRRPSDASKSSEISWSSSDASSSDLPDCQDYFEESNGNGGDRHMHALIKAMDDELSQHMTEAKKPVVNSVSLSDQADVQRPETVTIPFRAMNPSTMNDVDLEDELQSSLAQSRKEETFLEPGPATLLLKSLDDLSVQKS